MKKITVMDTITKTTQTRFSLLQLLQNAKKKDIGMIAFFLVLSIFLLSGCNCDEEDESNDIEITNTTSEHDGCVDSDQILACYQFNGNVNDASRFKNHGIAGGAVLTTDRFDASRSAYLFDGQDDYLEVGDSEELDLMDEFTINVWIYPTVRKSARILGKGRKVNGPSAGPYWMAIQNEIIHFYLRDDAEITYNAKGQIDAINNWSMVTAVFKDHKMYLYINAELQQVTDMPGRLSNVSNPLVIGSRLSLPADTFEGKIDDIGIYNYALNVAELLCLTGKIEA